VSVEVSVITTLYNYSTYIESAVHSFNRQTFKYSEMIIVDDGSTDDPYRVLKNLLSDRVKYIRLEKNSGYSHAKNVGIKESNSEVLVMLDADDMLTQRSLEIRYEELKKGYDLVHGPVTDIRRGQKSRSPLWNQWLASKKDASDYKKIHAQSVMLKKQIHREIGLYDESMKCKSDREMWARVLNHGYKVSWVDHPVSEYRIHPKQMHKSKDKLRINDRLEKEALAKMSRRKTDLSDVEMLK